MNMLKVTKWEGFTLFCLVTLSILLALSGLWAARGFQVRFSQVNPIQLEGKQMDMNVTGQKLAEKVHNTFMDLGKYYLTGGAVALDPSGRRNRFASLAGDPLRGEFQLTGGRPALDPSNSGGRIIHGCPVSLAGDSLNGGHLILAGYARKVDNTGRLQG